MKDSRPRMSSWLNTMEQDLSSGRLCWVKAAQLAIVRHSWRSCIALYVPLYIYIYIYILLSLCSSRSYGSNGRRDSSTVSDPFAERRTPSSWYYFLSDLFDRCFSWFSIVGPSYASRFLGSIMLSILAQDLSSKFPSSLLYNILLICTLFSTSSFVTWSHHEMPRIIRSRLQWNKFNLFAISTVNFHVSPAYVSRRIKA